MGSEGRSRWLDLCDDLKKEYNDDDEGEVNTVITTMEAFWRDKLPEHRFTINIPIFKE